MAYGDLLRALAEETEREARLIRAGAAQDAERALEEARRGAAEERERALAACRADEAAALARARARAARQVEAAALAEARRALDAVRTEALEVLQRRSGSLLPRLLDEVAALAGPGPVTVVVDEGELELARGHLARAHPELAARGTLRASAARRGGVELEQDGAVLDDTLPARLDHAWPLLEAEVAALLLGEGGGRDGGV